MPAVVAASLGDADLPHQLEIVPVADLPQLFPEVEIERLHKKIKGLCVSGVGLDLCGAHIGPAILGGPVDQLLHRPGRLRIGAIRLVDEIRGVGVVVDRLKGALIHMIAPQPIPIILIKILGDIEDHLYAVVPDADPGVGKDAGPAQIGAKTGAVGFDHPVDRSLSGSDIVHVGLL